MQAVNEYSIIIALGENGVNITMKKRFASILLLGIFFFTGGSAYGAETTIAQGNNTVLLLDGVAREVYPYNIDGNNYFKLRDLAALLAETNQAFSVQWQEEKGAIQLNTQEAYVVGESDLQFPVGMLQTEAEISTAKIYCNDNEVQAKAYTINGNNYFKLRDLGDAIGFLVGWDETQQLITITTTTMDNGTSLQQLAASGKADGSDIELDESFKNYDNSEELVFSTEEEVLSEIASEVEQENRQEVMDSSTPITVDVKTLLNNTKLQQKQTQFGILNELVEEFLQENLTEEMDTYTKVKTTYDYFCKNMQYKTASQLDMTCFTSEEAAIIWKHYPERYAIPILMDQKGVCNHYSSAYAAILQAIGFDVRVVSGQTKSSAGGYSGHVWVIVQIDGVDYLFDPQVEQRIAQRNGNVIQYYRFCKPVSQLQKDYQADKQYTFA